MRTVVNTQDPNLSVLADYLVVCGLDLGSILSRRNTDATNSQREAS
jgi:hypothetical protein